MRSSLVLLSMALALASCRADRKPPAICVAGPSELLGATVSVDGVEVGRLQQLKLHGTLFDQLLKELYPDSPTHDAVALNIAIDQATFTEGQHQVSVVQEGAQPLVQSFAYPDAVRDNAVFVFFLPSQASKTAPGH